MTTMSILTPDGQAALAQVAQRHGVSTEAASMLLDAIAYGGGTMAQFNIQELGGMGQWSQGGMIMVGDMFNNGLKYRVDALCNDLANLLRGSVQLFAPPPAQQNTGFGSPIQSGANWWPADLGSPSSSGGQNDMRYAYFPGPRRLAVLQNGQVTVYDTGDHSIGGFSQQQGGGQSATFSSQFGQFSLAQLPVVSGGSSMTGQQQAPQQASQWAPEPVPQWQAPDAYAPQAQSAPPAGGGSSGDPLAQLERVAELHRKGVLSDAEFSAKKAELLSRI
jgi:Short C-terminal domain